MSAMFSAPVWLKALKTWAPVAQPATISPPEMRCPITSSSPSGPMPTGFVQSIRMRPLRSPSPVTTPSVASQGVASTITSAPAAARAGSVRRSVGSFPYLASPGLRTPKLTSWPALSQARPSALPTAPAPMIAIRMALFLSRPLRRLDLHERGPIGPEQQRPHPSSRINPFQRLTIEAELRDVDGRDLRAVAGRRAVRLVVDDQHLAVGHDQPVHPRRQRPRRRAGNEPDDRHLGARAGSEQGSEGAVADHRQRLHGDGLLQLRLE